MPVLALLSTAVSVPGALDPLADELLPGVDRFHLVDERLLADARSVGVTPALVDRLRGYVAGAVTAGADAVLVTCSSIGEAAEEVGRDAAVPVCRIDAPMAGEAVARAAEGAGRVGVLATLASTLDPTTRLIRRAADGAGPPATVTPMVCDGAFDRLMAGDASGHDDDVRTALATLAETSDVIVLAQASMVRVLAGAASVTASDGRAVPVLTSPRSGIAQMAPVLGRS